MIPTPLRLRLPAGLTFGLFSSLLAAPPCAYAADFLIPGIQAKAAAGAGQTVSRGASSLFYNPANLSTARGLQPEVDLSIAQISYSYQNSDTETFEPAVLTTMTPLATFGLAWNPIPPLGLGVALLPTGAGSAQVANGVPAEIQPGDFVPMNITRKPTSFRAGLGASWEFNPTIAIGASMLYYNDTTSVLLQRSGTEIDFLKADYKGSSYQFVGGARITLNNDYVIGISYKSAATRHYQGTVQVNTASSGAPKPIFQESDFQGVGYDPSTIGFGVEGRWSNFGAFFDYVRERWSGGRNVYKQGLGSDADSIAMIDSNDITVGARFWPSPNQRLEAAFGMDGSNMADGDPVVKGQPRPPSGGIQVGQLEAVPRTIYAGGYRYALSRSTYLELAGAYMTGTRIVPDGYTQQGTFKLNVVLGSAGAAYNF